MLELPLGRKSAREEEKFTTFVLLRSLLVEEVSQFLLYG